MESAGAPSNRVPVWYWVLSLVGLAWNAFGVMEYLNTVRSTPAGLVASGLTEAGAAVMSSLPAWMVGAFAICVFGGLLGCILLLLRKKIATPVLTAALAASVVLFIGDYAFGVFAALGTIQVVVLTLVVLIAAGLVWLSRHFERSGQLT